MNASGFFSMVFLIVFTAFYADMAFSDRCYMEHNIRSKEDSNEFLRSLVDVEFSGKVTAQWKESFESLEDSESVISIKTIFEIDSVIKGKYSPGDKVLVIGNVEECHCVKEFHVGERYSIYSVYDDSDESKLFIKYCGFVKEIDAE